MITENIRINRESKTIEKMIEVYCNDHHLSDHGLCTECKKLLEYSKMRLYNCRYGENKTVCGKCPTHCYKKEMRDKIKDVMRYSGPRMIFIHPILTTWYYIDKLIK